LEICKQPKAEIGILNNPDGSTSVANSDKATTLNNFFSSVFCVEDLSAIPGFENNFVGPFLSEIQIEIEDVHEKLLGLNPVKSADPDNIHPRVLKKKQQAT